MQRGRSDSEILVRDKTFVKYERLLAKAEAEGRLSGAYRCLVCGMRYRVKEEAESCCRVGT